MAAPVIIAIALISFFIFQFANLDPFASSIVFMYDIDDTLQLSQAELPGIKNGSARPVGAIIGADGTKDEFVVNEVSYHPRNQEELDSFLTKYNGTILLDGQPRIIPGVEGNRTLQEPSGWFLVRVDLNRSSLTDMAEVMESSNIRGKVIFSSEDAARLAALVARESEKEISPNFVGEFLDVSEHRINSTTFSNAEDWFFMNEDDDTSVAGDQGLSTGVIKAWDYLSYKGFPRSLSSGWKPALIAVVDGGFDLDTTTGRPVNDNLDFPFEPFQADIVQNDFTAGGANLMSCSAGSACPWHGQQAASVAAAFPRNGFGTAGTAGDIALPMLIRVDSSFHTWSDGVRTAVWNGAEVVSMSLSGECNWWCRTFTGTDGNMERAVQKATENKVIIVAAAGNDGDEINNNYNIPCQVEGVICVGAVQPNGISRSYSNFGKDVDIWAPDCTYPTVIRSTSSVTAPSDTDADNLGLDELGRYCGTSGATPFVSGIVAMMKVLDPSLNSEQIEEILINTSNKNIPPTIPDPKVVTGWVDAYRAVIQSSPNQAPNVEIIEPSDGESVSVGGLSLEARVNDPEKDGQFYTSIKDITWTSDRNGQFCTSLICSVVGGSLDLGSHLITVTARDLFDGQASASVRVNVVNNPPTVGITRPNDSDAFSADQTIRFEGYADDPDAEFIPDSNFKWRSDINGVFGTGRALAGSLSAGIHTITLEVSDAYGQSGQASIRVIVGESSGMPVPLIANPSPNAYFAPGQIITFEGNATDAEDGTLPGPSLEWSSNVDGLIGTGNSIQAVLSSASNPCEYGDVYHNITLKATDSSGNIEFDRIQVRVGIIC